MYKLFVLISLICLSTSIAFGNYSDFYQSSIEYNWDEISQSQRDENVKQISAIMFGNDCILKYPQKKFKQKYKDYLKDKFAVEHYYAAVAGRKEFGNANIATFRIPHINAVYMYGLQYKNNLKECLYYDALGHLKYVDKIFGNYPDYPYFSRQYRVNGKMAGSIYFVSNDCQYVFSPKGQFKGLWLKNNFYDKKAKIIMTRSNY